MRSEHLEYFIAITQTGSINKASKVLHTSPQNVSKILQQFEEEVGTILMLRKPRGVVLTPAGKEMLKIASETIAQFADFKAKYKRSENSLAEVEGEISLVCAAVLNMYFMDDFLQSFHVALPQVRVSIVNVNRQNIFKRLEKEAVSSIAVIPCLLDKGRPNLPLDYLKAYQIEKIHQDKMILVVSKKSVWGQCNVLSAEKIFAEPVVLTPPAADEHSLAMDFLRKYGDVSKLSIVTRNIYNFWDYIAQGKGITIQSLDMFRHNSSINHEKFHVIDLVEDAVIETYLIYSQQEQRSLALGYFMDYAHAFFEV